MIFFVVVVIIFGTTVLNFLMDFPCQPRLEITFQKNTVICKTVFGKVKHSHTKAWDESLKYSEIYKWYRNLMNKH